MRDKAFQEIEHLAHNIWRFPQGNTPGVPQPNIGIIRDEDRTILIDAGNSPRHARLIQGELAAGGFPPVAMIIYTHHHWDHVFGAVRFPSALVIAHELCADYLRPLAGRSWSQAVLREETARDPGMAQRNQALLQGTEDWRDFSIRQPTLTFSTRMKLYLHNGMCLELHHVGGNHAPDSIVVGLPDAGLMFIGDCHDPQAEPAPASAAQAQPLLAAHLLDERYHQYIPGHSAPITSEALRRSLVESATSSTKSPH